MPIVLPVRCPAWLRLSNLSALILVAALAGGCSTAKPGVYSLEKFDTVSPYSRGFGLAAAQTCEAARRALLSHGYLVQRLSGELVDGRKSFQPSPDVHVEIEFHVVCAAVGRERSTVFVNALQDRYALKKTSGSASLGVGPLGSVSLPFWSSSDSMVKIASETILAGDFYDRFFALIEHQLAQVEADPTDDPAHAILPALVTEPGSSSSPSLPESSPAGSPSPAASPASPASPTRAPAVQSPSPSQSPTRASPQSSSPFPREPTLANEQPAATPASPN
jgi:hypothetical protein